MVAQGEHAMENRLKELTEKHRDVLNRLDSHLGCVTCRGPLVDGRCPNCQLDQFEMGDDGKLRLKRTAP